MSRSAPPNPDFDLLPPPLQTCVKQCRKLLAPLAIVALPLAGIATLLFVRFLMELRYPTPGEFWPQVLLSPLPFPFIFLLWLRLHRTLDTRNLGFHWLPASISIMAFILAGATFGDGAISPKDWRTIAVLTGVISGCLATVGFANAVRYVRRDPAAALIALFAGLICVIYEQLHTLTWEYMCVVTSKVITAFYTVIGIALRVSTTPEHFINLSTDYFGIRLEPPCSGMEGIFFFYFLLSIVLLLDWMRFRSFHLWKLYAIGFFYMAFLNAARISALFGLGHWAGDPAGSELARSFQGKPIDLFHSSIGFVLYTIAFGIFVNPLYSSAAESGEKINQPQS